MGGGGGFFSDSPESKFPFPFSIGIWNLDYGLELVNCWQVGRLNFSNIKLIKCNFESVFKRSYKKDRIIKNLMNEMNIPSLSL